MQQELLFKVLVIGDLGVGKTSIIKRYVCVSDGCPCVPGQERYGNMTRVYYREAVGALVVFDVTRASTFDAVLKWKDDLDSKVTLNHGRPVPAVLLANKSDQLGSQQPQLDSFCRENGFVGWFETSAKENANIEEAARCLVEHILNNEERPMIERDPSSLVLSGYTNTTKDHLNCSSCVKW
ncbi:ras-related protein Rab-38 isoform X2 [Siniperca chuatsi]|uniref:ras-related protein Rab-38 isoform X2 n=1 Tax=Siniperca chuatsi TaxID=119488 RepID=UPI001CE19DED|nr:ras-related protein Rab-38 isoform X2 [Siniperca chuatsi]